jgi:hypothetical protein
MERPLETLGIIAGNRSLPLLLAKQARQMGVRKLIAVAFDNETDPAIGELVDQVFWVKVGQLNKLISSFTRNGVKHCIMAGQIAPRNLFDLRPDMRAMKLLMRTKEKNAHTLFGAVAEELKKEGVELIDALPWLKPIMPGPGFRIGPELKDAQQQDVAFGFRMAKEIARLEIGQCVVVKNGTVLAVEGFEGTDECLKRGGKLAEKSGGAVAVKVARLAHDMRFDIPCVGQKTAEILVESGIGVIALESGCTLVLDEPDIEDLARRHGFTLLTYSESPVQTSANRA